MQFTCKKTTEFKLSGKLPKKNGISSKISDSDKQQSQCLKITKKSLIFNFI